MSVGPMEIIIVLALALLIFGPKRLPEMGRTLGRAAREFRKATDEVKGVFDIGLNDDDDAKTITGAAAVTATTPVQDPGQEPWRGEVLQAADPHAPAAGQPASTAVPGLAGFLGMAQVAPEPGSSAPEDGSATDFASFLGAAADDPPAADHPPAADDPPAADGDGGTAPKSSPLETATPETPQAPEAPAAAEAG